MHASSADQSTWEINQTCKKANKSPVHKVSLTTDASRLPLLADFVPNLPQAPSEWSVWESESRDKLVVAWQNVDQALKDLPKSHENVQQTCDNLVQKNLYSCGK